MIDWHCNDLVVLNLRPNTIAQQQDACSAV